MANVLPSDVDYVEFIGEQQSPYVKPLRDFRAEVTERLNAGPTSSGVKLPWRKTHTLFAFRPGEVSIIAGVGGSGKSLMQSQYVAWFPKGERTLIASLEMPPVSTIARMVRQTAGVPRPNESQHDDFYDFSDEQIWIYDQTDTVPQEQILGVIHYAAKELGVTQMVIDSLVKCGMAPDDYAAQKEFVDKLCWCAKSLKIHIHLVHHLRKGSSLAHIPDGYALKGAGEIRDLCDNLLLLHRCRDKEDAVEAGEQVARDDPDAILIVDKQRHGEFTGKFGLYFHAASQQFLGEPDLCPMPWN